MVGINNSIIFYPTAILMIIFAILTVQFRNLFYSLICAIMVFFFAGMLFYILGSEYNAVIQIAIYGIAVPVLLGLSIMFGDFKKNIDKTISNTKYIVISLGIFLGYIFYLSIAIFQDLIKNDNVILNSKITVGIFAQEIFINYVWAFEILSLILTITVVGLSIIKFQRRLK